MKALRILMIAWALQPVPFPPTPGPPNPPRATPVPTPPILYPTLGPSPTAPPSGVAPAPVPPFVTAVWLSTDVVEVHYSGGCLRMSDFYRLGCDGVTRYLRTGGDIGESVNGGEVFVVRDVGGVEVARATLGYPRRVWLGVVLR